jgi:hypothetical protein
MGAQVISCSEKFDTSTAMGRFVLTILNAIGVLELEERTEGWLRSKHAAWERGLHVGPTPTGYTRPKPIGGLAQPMFPNEHAPAIRRAFELRAAGASWSRVARHLNESGVPTSRGGNGGRWSLSSAEKLLRNEVYTGLVRCACGCSEERYDGPAIVTRALFRRVVERRQTRPGPQGEREPGLLSGVLFCASCGYRLTQDVNVRRNGTRVDGYRCRNAGVCTARASISKRIIEPFVESYVLRLFGPDRVEDVEVVPTAGEDTSEFEFALDRGRANYEAWLALDVSDLDAQAYRQGLQERRKAVDEAEDALEEAGRRAGQVEQFAHIGEAWPTIPLDDRRTILQTLFAHGIKVRAGRGPVEERVEFSVDTLLRLFAHAEAAVAA